MLQGSMEDVARKHGRCCKEARKMLHGSMKGGQDESLLNVTSKKIFDDENQKLTKDELLK